MGERQDVHLARENGETIVETVQGFHTFTEYPKGESPIYHSATAVWEEVGRNKSKPSVKASIAKLEETLSKLFPDYQKPEAPKSNFDENDGIIQLFPTPVESDNYLLDDLG